ncbi:MAG: hypothetical protein ACI9TB_001312, partial [Parasphingorhabdus sp.]
VVQRLEHRGENMIAEIHFGIWSFWLVSIGLVEAVTWRMLLHGSWS